MATTGRSESRLFVRNSTGLVRSASAVDATIFNAVISAPIGSTLAWSIFFTLVAFPGADPVGVLVIAAIINIPVLIMFALLGASMPRVGGDYVWVSRILNPPLALISNLCMIMGGLLGAAYFAKFFPIFALGPGAGRGRQHGSQQHADQLGQLVRDRQGVDPGRGPGHGRAADLRSHPRHEVDVPLAELVVPDRDVRDRGGVHRPRLRQQGRIRFQLQHAEQELRRRDGPGCDRHRGRRARRPGPRQHERDAAHPVLHPGLHDVELLVGLHVGRAEERVQPPPPAVGHVRRAGLRRRAAHHRRAAALPRGRLQLHVRGERVAQQGVRDPGGRTRSWPRCPPTSRSSP